MNSYFHWVVTSTCFNDKTAFLYRIFVISYPQPDLIINTWRIFFFLFSELDIGNWIFLTFFSAIAKWTYFYCLLEFTCKWILLFFQQRKDNRPSFLIVTSFKILYFPYIFYLKYLLTCVFWIWIYIYMSACRYAIYVIC